MPAALLHLITSADWRTALAAGVIAPPPLAEVGFVHLSAPEQVALPAARLFHGRRDVVLLVLDPERIGAEVHWEPGIPTDPASMRFPHAYGPIPTAAAIAVLPYRPRPDGGFDAPAMPATDTAGRRAGFEISLLRRAAPSETPATGGVAVINEEVPESYRHNQLLIDGDTDAEQLVADADRTLGAAGLAHRKALLTGAHLAGTAAGLGERGWTVERLTGMAARAGGDPDERVRQVDRRALRPMWDAGWRRDVPWITAVATAQLTDRYRAEEEVVDLRYLGVREDGKFVASGLLKIDGGTAQLDMLATEPGYRGRGYADAVLATAMAAAADAGCDLVALDALTDGWPRRWYGRRGFVEVGESWTVTRDPDPGS